MIKKIVILTAIALASIAGGFAYRYQREGGFPPTILRKAIEQQLSVASFQYEGALALEFPILELETEGASSSISIEFSGAVDRRVSKKPKSESTISFTIPGFVKTSGLIDPGFVSLQTRSVGSSLYAQLAALPKTAVDISPIIGQWVSINITSTTPRYFSSLNESSTPSFLLTAKPRLALIQYPVVRYIAQLEQDVVRGERARHYQFVIDREQLIALLSAVSTQVSSGSADFASIITALRSAPAAQFPTGEAWIGVDDGVLLRLTISGAIEQPLVRIPWHLDVSFFDYDAQRKITVPTKTVTLDEALEIITKANSAPAATLGAEHMNTWFAKASKPVQQQISAALAIFAAKYRLEPKTAAEYRLFDQCGLYHIAAAGRLLTPADFAALRQVTKSELAVSASELRALIARDYIEPHLLDTLQLDQILRVDSNLRVESILNSGAAVSSGSGDRNACRGLKIPAEYK